MYLLIFYLLQRVNQHTVFHAMLYELIWGRQSDKRINCLRGVLVTEFPPGFDFLAPCLPLFPPALLKNSHEQSNACWH